MTYKPHAGSCDGCCQGADRRIAELEAELAWWERNFLTADGDDAPTKLKKAEAEVERLTKQLQEVAP